MSAGGSEVVAGNGTKNNNGTTTYQRLDDTMNYEIKPPYVNLYKASEGFNEKPAWSAHNSMDVYSIDACTWSTCGGHGLHEVKDIQSGYGYYGHSMWGGAYGAFVEIDDMYFWLRRGGGIGGPISMQAGIFYSNPSSGGGGTAGDATRPVVTVM